MRRSCVPSHRGTVRKLGELRLSIWQSRTAQWLHAEQHDRVFNFPGARVLVVDDLDSNILALQAVLASLPVQIVTARSGQEALHAALLQDFAMILLDVNMPVLDGFETARLLRLRERSKYVPIIFLTATHDSPELITRGYSMGAVDYLIRPLDPLILRTKVEVFIELQLKYIFLRNQIEQLRRVSELKLQDLKRESEARHLSFLAMLSHDLRTPLNAVVGWSRILKSGELEHMERDQAVNTIDRNAQTLMRLTAELLDVSGLYADANMQEGGVDLGTHELPMQDFEPEAESAASVNTMPPLAVYSAQQANSPPSMLLAGIHALVVEDDPDSSELVEVVLRRFGADVTCVATVGAALGALAARRPDVLVSDIGLPDEDGLALIRRVRKTQSLAGLPAIAVSAYASRHNVRQALAAGFQAHLAKPIEPSQLGKLIATVLSG